MSEVCDICSCCCSEALPAHFCFQVFVLEVKLVKNSSPCKCTVEEETNVSCFGNILKAFTLAEETDKETRMEVNRFVN